MGKNVASIQFLRFVAATLVVLFHTSEALALYFKDSLSALFLHICMVGASGVHIFFVISGFVMVYASFQANTDDEFSTPNFLTKRALRIYPIYWVYSLLYLAFYYFFSVGKNLSIEQIFLSLLLWPGHSSDIIGPGWTLSFEVYFYVCFSIAMTLGLFRGLVALTLFFCAAIFLGSWFAKPNEAINVFTSTLLLEFLFGAWVGYAVLRSFRVTNIAANTMLTLAVAGFFVGMVFGYFRVPGLVTWGIPSALLVAGFVFRENNGALPPIVKRYSFLGDSSYSLYLLHILLIDAVIFFALNFVTPSNIQISIVGTYLMMLACFLITAYCIVVAFFAYKIVERPLVSLLQGAVRRRLAPSPATHA